MDSSINDNFTDIGSWYPPWIPWFIDSKTQQKPIINQQGCEFTNQVKCSWLDEWMAMIWKMISPWYFLIISNDIPIFPIFSHYKLFSHAFPSIFQWFSLYFPLMFLWCSIAFRHLFPWPNSLASWKCLGSGLAGSLALGHALEQLGLGQAAVESQRIPGLLAAKTMGKWKSMANDGHTCHENIHCHG